VVLGPGWPGILLHESDWTPRRFHRKGTSAFSGRLGERVASPLCTVVDEHAGSRRGSLNVDDEGTPTQCTTLIERGVLKGYLRTSSRPLDEVVRLATVAANPTPFAACAHDNTTCCTGEHEAGGNHRLGGAGPVRGELRRWPGDILRQVRVLAARRISLKMAASPARSGGATLIGNGPDVLTKVSMVGNDLQLDARSHCGKEGQSVRLASVSRP